MNRAFSDTVTRRIVGLSPCLTLLFLTLLTPAVWAQQEVQQDSTSIHDDMAAKRRAINARSASPLTPMTRDELLGRHQEGRGRSDQQRLETDFAGTRQAADHLRNAMLHATSPMTTERAQRLHLEGAQTLISNLNSIIRNRPAAIALGKALFWDSQVGSDGQTACASCHHQAGTDKRPFSLGVGHRLLTSATGEALSDGLEPSKTVEPDAILHMFESRWGGMIDFPAFLNDLALRALIKVYDSVPSPDFPHVEVQRVMGMISLTNAPNNILDKWNTLREKIETSAPVDAQKTDGVEARRIVTLVELSVYVLLYNNLAEPTSDGAVSPMVKGLVDKQVANTLTQDEGALQETLSGYTPKQLGAYGLGLRLLSSKPKASTPEPEKELQPATDAEDAYARGIAAGSLRHRLGLNSPTVINAALSDRLFHDGRAANVFNGYDHLGDDAGRDGIGKYRWVAGRFERVLIRIPDAALASQSTAPLLSTTEMSWWGRQFHHVARKLLDRKPLGGQRSDGTYLQQVAANDSHLGRYVNAETGRIEMTYRELIQAAFHPEWWQGRQLINVQERDAVTGDNLSLSQMEANFSLFWGLALWSYQNELISGESEFDRIMAERRSGKSVFAGQTQEQREHREAILRGYALFQQHACADCHRAPEMATGTRATVYGPVLEFEGPGDEQNAATETNEFARFLRDGSKGIDQRVEKMRFRRDQLLLWYDNGFYNVGVSSDRAADASFRKGVAGEVSPDLSSPSTALESTANQFGQGLIRDLFVVQPSVRFSLARRLDDGNSQTMGSIRTPTLRNVELTAPYFHLGWNTAGRQFPTLGSVLEHYENPTNVEGAENEFLHPALQLNPPQLDNQGNIIREGDTVRETAIPDHLRGDVSAFLRSLTDERVRNHLPPFDHPTLSIPTAEQLDDRGQTPQTELVSAE